MLRLLILMLCLAVPAAAESPVHGLLQNRSGLPLVFPLQIRTDPGLDYALLLTDAETGDRVLSAFIEGGRFFRVLVPPGTFRIHIAAGDDWVGPEELFGDDTIYYTYPDALGFGPGGLSRKKGHALDLRGMISETASLTGTARPIALCPGVPVLPLGEYPRPDPAGPEDPPLYTLPIPDQIDRLTLPRVPYLDRGPDRLC